MLTCNCTEPGENPGSWWYYVPCNFSPFNATRRKRCSSCKELIDFNSNCLEFKRERSSYTEIEQKISGDEITIASLFMCASCGEVYLNLRDIGYCLDITGSMQECLAEYHKLTGFKKETKC